MLSISNIDMDEALGSMESMGSRKILKNHALINESH